MKTRSVLFALTVWGAAGFTGCTQNDAPTPELVDPADRAALAPFGSCDDVMAYVHTQALEQVGPYGLHGEEYWGWGEGDTGAAGGDGGGGTNGDPAGGDGGGSGGGGAPDHSDTNVQEAGVDEPDLVKTDGTRILALADGQLHYVDLASGEPTLRGTVALNPAQLAGEELTWTHYGSEMLVDGDRVVIASHRDAYDLDAKVRDALGYDEDEWYGPLTELLEVDVSDPDAPALVGSLLVQGSYASGRKIDDTARFVVRSYPRGLVFKYPYDFLDESDYDETTWDFEEKAFARAEQLAQAHNEGVVRATDLEDWIPRYAYLDLANPGAALQTGALLDCERTYKANAFAGFGLLSVLTVDLSRGLALQDAVGVFTEGETVYASAESLYVATWPQYENLPEEPGIARTSAEDFEAPEIVSYVHKFDISQPEGATYRASGQVPGHLLDQWAMSEHEGDLRVATTDWGWWSEHTQSYVSVLRERAGTLELIGQVDGIGIDETIFGVRLMGERGYVVTFEPTDPLFTVDLSDPTDPRVVGELQMPGYSAYLHPVDDDLLIGIGRDGEEDGTLNGAGINLFDVSDPANPVRMHHAAFGDGWASSSVEWDHRAFLYWPAERLVVIPVVSYGEWDPATETQDHFAGAVAYRIDPDAGISLAGIIEHEPSMTDEWGWEYGSEIMRSLVIGDELFTMSASGIKGSDLQSLQEAHWVAF